MNTTDLYKRQVEPATDEAHRRQRESESTDISAMAVHRDPSRRADFPQSAAPEAEAGGKRTLAWVRPSELPTTLGSPLLRRGVDLEAELARRARRTPAQAAWRVRRRITRNAIGRPDPAAPTMSDQGVRL